MLSSAGNTNSEEIHCNDITSSRSDFASDKDEYSHSLPPKFEK